MNHTASTPLLLTPPRRSRRLLGGAVTLLALGAVGAVATLNYLGAGPAPITVTDTSGAATFNFRVTGIPVPGKIEGVRPSLTFDPRHLNRASGMLTLDLSGLNTGIALRDRHAREFLGVAAHPQARFTVGALNVPARIGKGQTLHGTVQGALDLNGVAVPLTAPVTLSERPDGSAINVKTAFNVRFQDHHISIPGADPLTDVQVAFRLPVHR